MSRHPLLAGWQAAKANFWPGLALQIVMIGVLIGYYRWPALHDALGVIAQWKQQLGYGFTLPVAGFAGGLLPEILRVLILQRGRLRRCNLDDARFGFFFWAMMGFCADTLYRWQGVWFGHEANIATVAKKVAVDLGIYTPLWGTTAIVIAYEWRKRGFTGAALRDCLTPRFYREHVIPALITGWALWLPLISVIYALPSLLQYPISAIVTAFWSLLVTFLGAQTKEPLAFGQGAEPK